jgi:hypothetical protein
MTHGAWRRHGLGKGWWQTKASRRRRGDVDAIAVLSPPSTWQPGDLCIARQGWVMQCIGE